MPKRCRRYSTGTSRHLTLSFITCSGWSAKNEAESGACPRPALPPHQQSNRVGHSRPVDKSTGLGADQSIALDGFYTRRNYPEHLRRVHF
jgi:hypothetical protein